MTKAIIKNVSRPTVKTGKIVRSLSSVDNIISKNPSINGIMTEKSNPGVEAEIKKPNLIKFKSGITAANRGLYDSHINYDGHTLYNGEIFNVAAKIKIVERNLPSKKIQSISPKTISIKISSNNQRIKGVSIQNNPKIKEAGVGTVPSTT